MATLVEGATSDVLGGPDWGLNLEICDAINQNPSFSRDVIKAIKKRLGNKSPKVQILTLTVLEMIMKNCGNAVHQLVAEKDVLHDMIKIVKKKGDPAVRTKILILIESWQKIFGGPKAKYPQYSTAYDGLQRSGVQFPVQVVGDTVLLMVPSANQPPKIVATESTLAASHTTRSLPQLAYGLPAGMNEVLVASENFDWSAKDLDSAQEGLDLMTEMLNALDPKDKQAVHNDLIVQLVEQCQTNQKIIRQLMNSTSDESLLCRGLSLNDDIQQVLAKHGEILSKSALAREETLGSSTSLVVYDHEDQTEDELLHLAHRSSAKASHLSASSLESGLRSNGQHPSSPGITMSTSDSLQSSSEFDASMGQVTPSKVAPPLDEHSKMIIPFGNMSSVPSRAPYHHPSSIANLQKRPSHESVHDEKSGLQQNGVTDEVRAPILPSPSEGCTSSLPQRQSPSQPNASAVFDDDLVNPFSDLPPSSLASEKKSFTNLPPPPILYTEREHFFKERQQMNRSPRPNGLSPSTMEQQLTDLNLISQDERAPDALSWPVSKIKSKNSPPAKKEARSVDRLFSDLIDFKVMRKR